MTTELIQLDKPVMKTGARKLKTMLLFPPEWVPTAPYLALPSLTAVLRESGHEVIQKDVNIEMYDLFFSDTFLIWIMARMSMQLRTLETKEMSVGLTDREADQKELLMSKSAGDVLELAERAVRAKRIVRGEEFYDADNVRHLPADCRQHELAADIPVDIDLLIVEAGEHLFGNPRPVTEIAFHRVKDNRGRIVGG